MNSLTVRTIDHPLAEETFMTVKGDANLKEDNISVSFPSGYICPPLSHQNSLILLP